MSARLDHEMASSTEPRSRCMEHIQRMNRLASLTGTLAQGHRCGQIRDVTNPRRERQARDLVAGAREVAPMKPNPSPYVA